PPKAKPLEALLQLRLRPLRGALRRLLAQLRVFALAAGAARSLGLAQLLALGAVQRLLRRLGLAHDIGLLSEFRLAVVIGQRRGPAALALIALRTGRRKLRLGPQPMVMIAELRAPLFFPNLVGAPADLLLSLRRSVGHDRPRSAVSGILCRN